MIICTVILALLAVLISTEADPPKPAPGPEQAPPPQAPPVPTSRPLVTEPDSDPAVIPGVGNFRLVRLVRPARAILPFPVTRTRIP